MSDEIIAKLGPLAPLAGIWQSDAGVDTSRIHGNKTVTKFRERIVFDPLGPVNNGPQELYGLRYSTTCWRLGEEDAFHEEVGYWLWDEGRKQVIRSFLIPRGVALMAGAYVEPDSKSFRLEAEAGAPSYGILSNRYLDDSYKTKRYCLEVNINDDGSFSYWEDTELWIPIDQEIFHHTDENTLQKV